MGAQLGKVDEMSPNPAYYCQCGGPYMTEVDGPDRCADCSTPNPATKQFTFHAYEKQHGRQAAMDYERALAENSERTYAEERYNAELLREI